VLTVVAFIMGAGAVLALAIVTSPAPRADGGTPAGAYAGPAPGAAEPTPTIPYDTGPSTTADTPTTTRPWWMPGGTVAPPGSRRTTTSRPGQGSTSVPAPTRRRDRNRTTTTAAE
jgi:hypothetical protein